MDSQRGQMPREPWVAFFGATGYRRWVVMGILALEGIGQARS